MRLKKKLHSTVNEWPRLEASAHNWGGYSDHDNFMLPNLNVIRCICHLPGSWTAHACYEKKQWEAERKQKAKWGGRGTQNNMMEYHATKNPPLNWHLLSDRVPLFCLILYVKKKKQAGQQEDNVLSGMSSILFWEEVMRLVESACGLWP